MILPARGDSSPATAWIEQGHEGQGHVTKHNRNIIKSCGHKPPCVYKTRGAAQAAWKLIDTTYHIKYYSDMESLKAHSGDRNNNYYPKISNIRRTQIPNFNVSRLVLQLSLPNPMKPGVKSRMKMQLEQRRQAMLQLHLSDRQFYCLLMCVLY